MDKYKVVIETWGCKIWLLNGEMHREDGPAVVYLPDESTANWSADYYWYLNGNYIAEKEYNRAMANHSARK